MRTIRKDFIREIRGTKSRFLSILILVALAVAFLSGLRATAPDMKRTCDRYMDAQNFMDIQVLSTLGLTEEDLAILRAQPDVSDGEGAYVIDALTHTPELDLVTKVYSLPERINRLQVTEGRLPQAADECAVEKKLLQALHLSLGDSIALVTSGSFETALTRQRFTIVGTVVSPYYISAERGSSTLGTGQVSAYLFLPRESFSMDFYTAAYLTVKGAAEEIAFSQPYQDRVEAAMDALEPLGEERAAARHDALAGEAAEKLTDAQGKLDDARAEAEQALADAWAELKSARAELDDGWVQVQDARETLARETADAQGKIDDARRKLTDAQLELDDGEGRYADGFLEYQRGQQDYAEGLAQYEDGLAQYQDGRKALAEAAGELAAASNRLAAARRQLQASQDSLDALLDTLLGALDGAGLSFPDRDALLEALRADTEGVGVRPAADAVLGQLYALSKLDSAGILALLSGGDPEQIQTAGMALELALPGVNAGLTAAGLGPYADSAALAEAMADPDAGPMVCAAVDQALSAVHSGLSKTDETGAATDEPLDSAALLQAADQLDAGWASYRSGQARLEAGQDAYADGWRELQDAKADLEQAKADLEEAGRKLEEAEAELIDARKELDQGWVDLENGFADVESAEAELRDRTAEAQGEIDDAVRELRRNEVRYNDGLNEYCDAQAEARTQIGEAERKLTDARRKAAELEDGAWYILSRDSNPGYLGFGQDADRMANLASVFPVLFFLVAALVCLTTMTRMVEEQRTQIGCLKALGYSRWAISRKYLGYGLLPSLLGGVLGLGIGFTLFPSMIFTAYQIMYDLPNIELHVYPLLSVGALLAAAGCTTLASAAACLSTLSAVPAELMRPRTPPPGKRVFLESIRPLWRRLSFRRKVTARNLFRYQKRFFMTVIGISGCTALIIAGFGLRTSLLMTMDVQYGDLYTYTAQISTSASLLDEEQAALTGYLDRSPAVVRYLPCRISALSVQSDAYSTTAYLEVVDPAQIGQYVKLRTFGGRTPLTLSDDGVIIDQKLSELLNVQPGDFFTLDAEPRVQVRVAAVTEHYLGHFVYMSPGYYQSVFGAPAERNACLLTLRDESPDAVGAVFSELLQLSGVTSATRMENTRDTYQHSMERVDFVVVIVILCAAALALVVLYNLSNINITERRRELATIKVLGFYDREVCAYVNRENVVLTAAGIALGLVLGRALHLWLVRSVEIDLMMFGRSTDPMALLWAAVLTALFSGAVNLLAGRRIRSIDMVESLKSAE